MVAGVGASTSSHEPVARAWPRAGAAADSERGERRNTINSTADLESTILVIWINHSSAVLKDPVAGRAWRIIAFWLRAVKLTKPGNGTRIQPAAVPGCAVVSWQSYTG